MMTKHEIKEYYRNLKEQEEFDLLINKGIIDLKLYKIFSSLNESKSLTFISFNKSEGLVIDLEEFLPRNHNSCSKIIYLSNGGEILFDSAIDPLPPDLMITRPEIVKISYENKSTYLLIQDTISDSYFYSELSFKKNTEISKEQFISSSQLKLRIGELKKSKLSFKNNLKLKEIIFSKFRSDVLKFSWSKKYEFIDNYLWLKLNKLTEIFGISEFSIIWYIDWIVQINKLIDKNVYNLDTLIIQALNTIDYCVTEYMEDELIGDIKSSLGADELYY